MRRRLTGCAVGFASWTALVLLVAGRDGGTTAWVVVLAACAGLLTAALLCGPRGRG